MKLKSKFKSKSKYLNVKIEFDQFLSLACTINIVRIVNYAKRSIMYDFSNF